MEANHQEQEEVEAQMEDARGGQSPPQRLTRSMFKALGANGRLFSPFVISLCEGAQEGNIKKPLLLKHL